MGKRLKIILNLNELKEHKGKAVFYIALRLILSGAIVVSVIRGNWENLFTCLLTLALMTIPSIIEKRLKIELPTVMEIIVTGFVFAANFLGEIASFYNTFPLWDSILHTINGFICAGVGFGLIDILNSNNKIKMNLSPVFVVLFSFCFSMTAGVVWEFFEFAMDSFFGTDMQKDTILGAIHSYKLAGNHIGWINAISDLTVNGKKIASGYIDLGLIDTMKDLLLNYVGASVFNTAGYFYLKTRKKKADFIENFIPVKIEEKEQEKSAP